MSKDDLIFKVIGIDNNDKYAGAESIFDIDEEFTFEELKSAIADGEETISGYSEYDIGDFGEITVTFYGLLEDDNYEEDCTIKFQVSVSADVVENALDSI